MQVTGNTEVGSVKGFATNGGPHTPDTLAEITLTQLVHPDSNAYAVSQIKETVYDMHEAVQDGIRELFSLINTDDEGRKFIIQTLARDFATEMQDELNWFKEK